MGTILRILFGTNHKGDPPEVNTVTTIENKV